jgi:two-component system sensor histidine kinase HydH
LGLATTRKIIEAHGGEIGVESEPGRGTRFTIRLPVERQD